MEEHLRFDKNGALLGLYRVGDTADNTNSWEAIDQAIRDYASIHPAETELTVRENAMKRDASIIGSNKSKTMRHSVSLPVALYFKLQQIMPDLFTNKNKLHLFMKKYQGFRTCTRV